MQILLLLMDGDSSTHVRTKRYAVAVVISTTVSMSVSAVVSSPEVKGSGAQRPLDKNVLSLY
jgi:hypothetical protein